LRKSFIIFLAFISLISNAQILYIEPTAKDTPPSMSGMPDVSLTHHDKGWGLKMLSGSIFLFTADKERHLWLLLNPASGEITPHQVELLRQMSIPPDKFLPLEFYAVPYAKGRLVQLYRCVLVTYQNRVVCGLVPLSTTPVPPHRVIPTGYPLPSTPITYPPPSYY
jgi:hypothetical protein